MTQSKKLLWAALLVCGSFLEAGAQVAWTLRNPSPAMKTVQGITWTGTLAVAVGDTGMIATSTNGSYWTIRNGGAATNNALTAVASGGGNLVAVGIGGIGRRSTDGGLTWAPVTTGTSNALYAVAWCNSRFVAVGAAGTVITSLDGSTWVAQSSGTSAILRALTYTDAYIAAVGDGGILTTSPDGTTWSTRAWGSSISSPATAMYGIQWAAGKLIVVGDKGEIRTSSGVTPDALTWTKQTSGLATTLYLTGVVWTGSVYVAVGGGGTIVSSPDGIVWTTATSGTTDILRAVVWTSTRFLAVGNAGQVRASTTGTSWGSGALTTLGLNAAAWSSGKSRVIAADGGNVLTSTTDTGWVVRATGQTQPLYGVTYAGNQFVAVGNAAAVVTSADGDVWAVRSGSPATEILTSVAWSGGTLAAVGGAGRIITSPDGVTWTNRPNTSTNLLYSITWCSTQFVAVGLAGTVLTSPNGVTWTSRNSGSTTAIYRGVTCADNQIVAVGSAGVVITSPDGIAWTTRVSGTGVQLNSVAWNGTALLAAGAGGTLITSVDGINWIPQVGGTASGLNAATNVGTGWIAIGAGGALQTAPNVTLPGAPTPTSPALASTGVSVFGPLVWGSVSGALKYRVQLATDSGFVGLVVNDTVTATSKTTPALSSTTLYYWRVRSENQLGGGAWSSTQRFTTGTAPTTPPPTPVLVAPEIFATGVAIPVTLVWNPSNGAESYHVQLSISFNFATTLLKDSAVTTVSRAFAGLTGGVSYYWRVRAKNGLGVSEWSDPSTFTTLLAVPAAPALLFPAQFATGVDRVPQLKWDTVSAAVKYHMQLALDGGFATVVGNDSSGAALTYSPPAILAATTDHFWRVRARNGAGWGPYSEIRRFTTGLTTAILPTQKQARFFQSGANQYLRFSLARSEQVQIRLYDLQGRMAAAVLNDMQSAGEHTVVLPAGLPESLYMVEFRVGTHREWLKIHP